MDIFSLVLLGVTAVALTLSIWQVMQTRRLVKDHAEAFSLIRDSLPTQFVGSFPDHIPVVTELIRRATKSVVIQCDLPGYGQFSSPRAWFDYRTAIEEKLVNGVHVQITCLSEGMRDKHHLDQYSRQRDHWSVWIADRDVAERVKQSVSDCGVKTDSDNPSPEEFRRSRAIAQQKVLSEFFQRAEIIETDKPVDLYFWVADDTHAIVAFPSFVEVPADYAFVTSDPRLIEALRLVHGRYAP